MQAEVAHHGIEVPVVVQQTMAALDAEGSYDDVNGFPDGDAEAAQGSAVMRADNRHTLIKHGCDGEAPKAALDPGGVRVVAGALQDFQEDQVANQDVVVRFDERLQLADRLCIETSEVGDPNRAVNEDRGCGSGARPSRCAARSPVQPRPLMSASACKRWWRRTSWFRASATVAFFVGSPVAVIAAAMSLSSISMFVRIAGLCVGDLWIIHMAAKAVHSFIPSSAMPAGTGTSL